MGTGALRGRILEAEGVEPVRDRRPEGQGHHREHQRGQQKGHGSAVHETCDS